MKSGQPNGEEISSVLIRLKALSRQSTYRYDINTIADAINLIECLEKQLEIAQSEKLALQSEIKQLTGN